MNDKMKVPKVAIFYTDYESDWVKPWKSFAHMGIKVLEQGRVLEGDHEFQVEYPVFDIYHEQFPDLQEITKENGYIGIYITGSKFDSFDTETKWIVDLRKYLKVILNDTKYPPVAGICFGHQVVAASLGCKVGRNPKGFEGGVVPVIVNPAGQDLFRGLDILNLSEMHKDVVLEVPQGCINWGSTPQCELQGFYKPQRLLTFQGHPEFTNMIVKWGLQRIPQDIEANVIDSIDKYQNDGPRSAAFIWKLFKREI